LLAWERSQEMEEITKKKYIGGQPFWLVERGGGDELAFGGMVGGREAMMPRVRVRVYMGVGVCVRVSE
jgi:hypothetical protein